MDAVNSCSICLVPYDASNSKKLSCDHEFHQECITRWEKRALQIGPLCPLCRKAFDLAMEETKRFSIWYEEQKRKEPMQRVVVQIATSVACGIAIYKIARFGLSYFTSLNPTAVFLCKSVPPLLGLISFTAVREALEIRHKSRKELEKQNGEETINKAIQTYNERHRTDLTRDNYNLYCQQAKMPMEIQIDMVLDLFYKTVLDPEKWPGLNNRKNLFCEADLPSVTPIAEALERLRTQQDIYLKALKPGYLELLQTHNLETYTQLTELGLKIMQTGRYENIRIALCTQMSIMSMAMAQDIYYHSGDKPRLEPLAKTRIAVINALERAKMDEDIPGNERRAFQEAINLVQAECKEPGAPFIQQILGILSEDPDGESLNFTEMSLFQALTDVEFIGTLFTRAFQLHPQLILFQALLPNALEADEE